MRGNEHYTETELLQLTAEGNEEAFRQLFQQYWDNIYGVSFMLTKSQSLAEDMVQEIFLKIWIKKDQLTLVNDFENYLFILARNHIFDTLRKRSREEQFTKQLADHFKQRPDNPEQKLLGKESANLIQQAISNLPEQQRLVYLLSRDKGLRQEEIAEQLGISRNTVRNHMARALKSLREFLQNHTEGLLLLICLIDALLPI